jgi:hypothetical protein
MIETNALRRVNTLRTALVGLSVEGYVVKRFFDRPTPLIELQVGDMSWEHEEKKGYIVAPYKNCEVFWKDRDLSNKY